MTTIALLLLLLSPAHPQFHASPPELRAPNVFAGVKGILI